VTIAVVVARRSSSTTALPPITAPLPAYSVTYEVDTGNGSESTEHRVVRHPFESRSETDDASGKPTAGSITNATGFFSLDASTGRWSLITQGAHRSGSDPQPLAALHYAVAHDLAQVSGTRTVAGRPCIVVRTGAPFGEPLAAPTESDHVDVCLERSGVPLSYEWTAGGHVLQRMTAVEFDDSPTIAPDEFTLPAPIDTAPEQAATTVTILSPDQFAPYPAISPPPGFALRAAYLSSDAAHKQDTTTVALFDRNAQTVSVTFKAGSAPPAADAIDLGNGLRGSLDVRLDTTSLTVAVPPSVTVTVLGAAPDDVVEFARGLRLP
jgi:hypothetical protein